MKKLVVWPIATLGLLSMIAVAAAQQAPVGSPGYVTAPANAGPALASSATNEGPRWGLLGDHALNIGSKGFMPLSDGQWEHFDNGWSYRSGGTNTATCANVNLPSGATVSYIDTNTEDVDATHSVSYTLTSVDLTTNTAAFPFSFTTVGTPGIERGYARLVSPAVTINNNRNTYALCIIHSGIGPNTRHSGTTIWYRLQVSPAPASASFSDVPTGHWAFQFIEALRESGITSGCTATTFCPNAAVTRAEMAVFLGRALGLAWSP